MANYLTSVITASFVCAVVSSLLKDNGTGKTAKAVVNIVMLSVMIIPIINGISNFSHDLAIPVINDEYRHSIDNKENEIILYRQWLARVTASELSDEIEKSVKSGTGITVRVECPWHTEGENVVFDKIKIYTASEKRYYERIVNYVKLHFSLECECQEEVE